MPPSASASALRYCHLATQCRICRLELDNFNNQLVRHKLYETSVERVGMRGRLAGRGRRVVGERDAERATFAGVERMHVAVMPVGTIHVATARASRRAW